LQFAGEVLSVVSHQSVAQAEKNAASNNIKNVHYFGGGSVEALSQIAEKISCEKACAVVICTGGKYL
jgi:tRNA/tmRNA/rRNA uracil-C5-methylase (TrmA/RlmC/RlmD family)